MPTQGLLHFVSDEGRDIQKISVCDLQGRLVFEQSYNSGKDVIDVNLPAEINSGIYIYTISVNHTLHSGKIIFNK
jgi:hypothetical protein